MVSSNALICSVKSMIRTECSVPVAVSAGAGTSGLWEGRTRRVRSQTICEFGTVVTGLTGRRVSLRAREFFGYVPTASNLVRMGGGVGDGVRDMGEGGRMGVKDIEESVDVSRVGPVSLAFRREDRKAGFHVIMPRFRKTNTPTTSVMMATTTPTAAPTAEPIATADLERAESDEAPLEPAVLVDRGGGSIPVDVLWRGTDADNEGVFII